MTTDPVRMASSIPAAGTSRVECTLGNDPRLMACLVAVIAHAAQRAGLPERTHEDLVAAAIEASRGAAISGNGKGSSASATKLLVEEFPDRVEVTIESSNGAARDAFRNRLEGKVVDRIRWDGREGRVRLTILKPCGAVKSNTTP